MKSNYIDVSKTVSFSGYRSFKLPFAIGDDLYCAFRKRLTKEIISAIDDGYDTFLTGGCEGFDTISAEIVLSLRNNPRAGKINLHTIVPFIGQEKAWSESQKRIYNNFLFRSNSVITLSEAYYSGVYHIRNKFLVENSSRLICFFDGQKGGTSHTFHLAKKCGLEIRNIAN